jgi:hypothetical protein
MLCGRPYRGSRTEVEVLIAERVDHARNVTP